MSTLTAQTTVQSGRYSFFSAAELEIEKENYKATVKAFSKARLAAAGGEIALVSMNGKQVQYDHSRATAYLKQWEADLKDALNQIAGEYSPHSDRAALRF